LREKGEDEMSESSGEDTRAIKTLCHMCDEDCGITVHVSDGTAVRVEGMAEHPLSYFEVCPKARAILDYVYAPDRLKFPQMRVDDTWRRISWDEALDTIAKKLEDIRKKDGMKAVAILQGYGTGHEELKWYMQRFSDVYGTPNFASIGSLCYHARAIGLGLTYGGVAMPDYQNAKCILIWGCNPKESVGRSSKGWLTENYLASNKRPAKLVVIDPRRTPFAKVADVHARIRPGTDAALGLGMLNVIIQEGLYDRDFVDRWTVGFEELAKHIENYPPEKVEEITYVPANIIEDIARIYATSKNACIIHDEGVDGNRNGVQAARTIGILEAVTGNIDVAGGNVFPPKLSLTYLRIPENLKEKPLGAEEYPLYYEFWHEGQAMVWWDTLLTGKPYPLKAMIIAGANPLLTFPNTAKVRRALEKLDLLVVFDDFMTETAKMADIVLPASTFLERTQHKEYGSRNTGYVTLRRAAVGPLWESWPDWKFWFKLAKRMGYQEYFPWNDVEEAIEFLLKPSEVTLERLKQNPGGVHLVEKRRRSYEDRGFGTPSKKVEIYSEKLRKYGYEPLPVHVEPEESPVSSVELAKDYPLILTTGSRIFEYTHSQLRNIPRLRERVPYPYAEINPKTARESSIRDSDEVVVESKRGVIKVKVKVTEDVPTWLVNIPHGWAEANVNLLTDDGGRDPISGFPPLKSLLCRVRKPSASSNMELPT